METLNTWVSLSRYWRHKSFKSLRHDPWVRSLRVDDSSTSPFLNASYLRSTKNHDTYAVDKIPVPFYDTEERVTPSPTTLARRSFGFRTPQPRYTRTRHGDVSEVYRETTRPSGSLSSRLDVFRYRLHTRGPLWEWVSEKGVSERVESLERSRGMVKTHPITSRSTEVRRDEIHPGQWRDHLVFH